MSDLASILPHVNAALNSLACLMLVGGLICIKRGRERAHKWTMLASFAVSVLFLVSYLIYHYLAGSKEFPDYPPTTARYFYFTILISHVVLAATVPFLALTTIYLALRDRRRGHARMARITFPIWLYVSITGVVIYLMLYQLYPPLDQA